MVARTVTANSLVDEGIGVPNGCVQAIDPDQTRNLPFRLFVGRRRLPATDEVTPSTTVRGLNLRILCMRIGEVHPCPTASSMASVPALIVGAFFLVVGALLMPVSVGEGFVVVFIGLVCMGAGLLWGIGSDSASSGTGRETTCAQCGWPNGTGSVYCTRCGFYLPLPA